ncbi:unnamed protein product (macronuclear) [Paramecium tetraurelia]|uniref:C2 domain-containing protein n=1 Tax=Paramecium tetraurelia TaxID=5888 RepID=A0E5G2_PARTE|nr:uncharacterized protein GSPATT00003390001 [Paramecium tetraurelia]CAK90529.1 unnamed protein product [Paramecium tetraurelia]|eukprot:XP_001457926.1 hypothetical protein (macronuclear) [Paramecium tetraurelia strain d4-2]
MLFIKFSNKESLKAIKSTPFRMCFNTLTNWYLVRLGFKIGREFPNELIEKIRSNHPTHAQGYYFTVNDLVEMTFKEYQNQLQIKQESNNQILVYRSEYKKLQDELQQARKDERQNEYEIDNDSTLFITVSHGECLKMAKYQILITLFTVQQQTKISDMTIHPIWNEEFQIHVPSPHGQIFVGLFDTEQHLIGQLQLPLYQYKDQQQHTQDYILENEYGVLINSKLKLNLTILWVHSKVALLEDHITSVNQFRKEIEEQQVIVNKANYLLDALTFTFNRSRIQRMPQITNVQQQFQQPAVQQSEEQDWKINYQDTMYTMAKQFKREHQDTIEEWQRVVMILSSITTIFSLIFVSLSRPCFQQLTSTMSIGMLVWAYRVNYIKTTKILAQISLIILIQCIFDTIWLIINYVNSQISDFRKIGGQEIL